MNKHNKILSLAKTNWHSIKVLISRVLIESYISHDEFVIVNNKLNEYDDMKEEIETLKISTVNQRFSLIYNTILSDCLKCKKNKESKNLKFVLTKK